MSTLSAGSGVSLEKRGIGIADHQDPVHARLHEVVVQLLGFRQVLRRHITRQRVEQLEVACLCVSTLRKTAPGMLTA